MESGSFGNDSTPDPGKPDRGVRVAVLTPVVPAELRVAPLLGADPVFFELLAGSSHPLDGSSLQNLTHGFLASFPGGAFVPEERFPAAVCSGVCGAPAPGGRPVGGTDSTPYRRGVHSAASA